MKENPIGQYSIAILIRTVVLPGRIELIYKSDCLFSYANGERPEPKIWKEIYKTELLEKVEGRFISAQYESYNFEK